MAKGKWADNRVQWKEYNEDMSEIKSTCTELCGLNADNPNTRASPVGLLTAPIAYSYLDTARHCNS